MYGFQSGRSNYYNEVGELILEYIRVSGVITKEQAYLIWPEKHYSSIDRVLRGLVSVHKLFLKGERYYVLNPKSEIDFNMINCMWVVLDLKGKEKLNTNSFWFSKVLKPAYLSYVKNGVLYDVVPVEKGEDVKLMVLEKDYELEKGRSDEILHKYIIVSRDTDTIESFPIITAPHIYAVVNELPFDEMDYEHKQLVNIEYYGE